MKDSRTMSEVIKDGRESIKQHTSGFQREASCYLLIFILRKIQ